MKNIIVISSGHYTNFCNTLRELRHLRERIKIHIYAPYENRSIDELKSIFDIELKKISKRPSQDEYENIANTLNKYNCTVLVYSKYLIPSCIYNKAETINFHPSKLPLYPGLNGWEDALRNKHLAFTAHSIDESVDLGKKIISCQIKPFPHKSTDDIRAMSHELCQILSSYIIRNSINSSLSSTVYKHFESASIKKLKQKTL